MLRCALQIDENGAQSLHMENTAKNFALQLGSLISLYISVGALIVLLFGLITLLYPDAADMVWEYESAQSSIRFSIALIVVFFPTYLLLTRMVNVVRRTEQGTYLTLTKWLIYLSLLIGGAALLGDLVAVINSFLSGDIALRFVLKALAFFVVVGLAFTYYLLDVRGYWQSHEKESIQYGIGAGVVVVVALIGAFMNIQSPALVREAKIDSQQIVDLGMIQSTIVSFYIENNAFPGSLDVAYLSSGINAPSAPEGRDAYEYHVLTPTSFELCATFAEATPESQQTMYGPYTMPVTSELALKNPDNWNHGAGKHCFTRILTQEFIK